MMYKKAFPSNTTNINDKGMTLHQYYAGQAISGICNRSFDVEKIYGPDLRLPFIEWASDIAIEIADEVIKKLEA